MNSTVNDNNICGGGGGGRREGYHGNTPSTTYSDVKVWIDVIKVEVLKIVLR